MPPTARREWVGARETWPFNIHQRVAGAAATATNILEETRGWEATFHPLCLELPNLLPEASFNARLLQGTADYRAPPARHSVFWRHGPDTRRFLEGNWSLVFKSPARNKLDSFRNIHCPPSWSRVAFPAPRRGHGHGHGHSHGQQPCLAMSLSRCAANRSCETLHVRHPTIWSSDPAWGRHAWELLSLRPGSQNQIWGEE